MVDPTVAHGMKSALPLVWSDEVFASSRNFWEDAQAHGLRVGWAQSCHNASGIVSMLTLARSSEAFSQTELSENYLKMSWLSLLAHEGLSRLLMDQLIPKTDIPLTSRESEVMKWTAEGKTSSEVADIMNISDSTVNFHVQNAVSKLGCANKTAAAIKAVILRLI